MSFFPGKDPVAGDAYACDAIERVIVPRTSDLGGFSVRRALPSAQRRPTAAAMQAWQDRRARCRASRAARRWSRPPSSARGSSPSTR